MHSVESVKFKCYCKVLNFVYIVLMYVYSALCTERDLRLPMSYNSIEEPFVMKTDSLFLKVVEFNCYIFSYLKGLIRCQRQFRGSDCVGLFCQKL